MKHDLQANSCRCLKEQFTLNIALPVLKFVWLEKLIFTVDPTIIQPHDVDLDFQTDTGSSQLPSFLFDHYLLLK